MHFDETAYRKLRTDIYGFAYRRLGDHTASEDVVQDSFVRLAHYAPDTVRNVGAMLRRIARNLIVDHARLGLRRAEDVPASEIEIPSEQPSQEHAMLQRERMDTVSRIIATMPRQRREVFILRRLHGLSAKDVAAQLDISPSAVDAHVARAVLSLHRAMASQDEPA
ncbi:RNA polymerase sigma factor [Novosphingobium mangrovi (ex Hu et al. 2023)]|uniref:RNA polymerase sigma factor n=1 Tax=Novosphingobium mangrovi (ex Hu et al. 2023) TaxID=2930094 RepID=A0ABT0ADN6_9SPHN|nr:RNA polymerase sigma factor [Novosphingobium mangrovi (ex Hu et al. 2023)]MCJ1961310.1 RNA polymerase sigma factor [Novosphingobium mangrovi (ex Hu et al. 2023)]